MGLTDIALQNLRRRKIRSALLVLSVVIGVDYWFCRGD